MQTAAGSASQQLTASSQVPASDVAGGSGGSGVSAWLSSPLRLAASTLRSLGGNPNGPPPPLQATRRAHHTALQPPLDQPPPPRHQPTMSRVPPLDALNQPTGTAGSTASALSSSSVGLVLQPVAASSASVNSGLAPAPTTATAAAAAVGLVYPVQTQRELEAYTAALLAASRPRSAPRPPPAPAPASQFMPVGGASKGVDEEDAVGGGDLPTDDHFLTDDLAQRRRLLHHSQPHSHPHTRAAPGPPLYGVVCGMSRRGSFDSLEDDVAAAESLRWRLQRQLQLPYPQQPSPPPLQAALDSPSALRARVPVRSPDTLPTDSPTPPPLDPTQSAPSAAPTATSLPLPLPPALPSALPLASHTAAPSFTAHQQVPTRTSGGAPPLASAGPLDSPLLVQPSATPVGPLHTEVIPSPPLRPLSPNGTSHARAHSQPLASPSSASSAPRLPPVLPSSTAPSPPGAAVAPAASFPDLSSFSSASFEEREDGDDTDTDREDSLGGIGGVSALLPDLGVSALLPGLRLPFGLGASRAQPAPPAEPTHFSSTSMRDDDFAGLGDSSADPPRNVKLLNFERLLTDDQADLGLLRSMSWNGIPASCRAMSWKLLLGYVPVAASRRGLALQKRRAEYADYLRDFYFMGPVESYDESLIHRTETEHEILKQIRQDVPRTSPTIPFFKDPPVQRSLERILYIFAIRHPASGYVQGINDLATPFYTVFADELYGLDVLSHAHSTLAEAEYLALEADVCWCLGYLVDTIQDNYTFAQPGIQRMVYRLKNLVARIDGDSNTTSPNVPAAKAASATAVASAKPHIGLHDHLERENVQFLHFSFRWMCTLLLRELRLPLILRLWDSYLAEPDGFKVLHVYVCAAFLMHWKDQLKAMDFQQLIQFLQKLPTESWVEQDIETLLAQAHVYKTLFHFSPHHLA